MSNRLTFPQEKHLYKKMRGEFGFKLLRQAQRKNTARMKEIAQKSTEPRNMVVGAFAETFSVSEASMLLPKHRKFKG